MYYSANGDRILFIGIILSIPNKDKQSHSDFDNTNHYPDSGEGLLFNNYMCHKHLTHLFNSGSVIGKMKN